MEDSVRDSTIVTDLDPMMMMMMIMSVGRQKWMRNVSDIYRYRKKNPTRVHSCKITKFCYERIIFVSSMFEIWKLLNNNINTRSLWTENLKEKRNLTEIENFSFINPIKSLKTIYMMKVACLSYLIWKSKLQKFIQIISTVDYWIIVERCQ